MIKVTRIIDSNWRPTSDVTWKNVQCHSTKSMFRKCAFRLDLDDIFKTLKSIFHFPMAIANSKCLFIRRCPINVIIVCFYLEICSRIGLEFRCWDKTLFVYLVTNLRTENHCRTAGRRGQQHRYQLLGLCYPNQQRYTSPTCLPHTLLWVL